MLECVVGAVGCGVSWVIKMLEWWWGVGSGCGVSWVIEVLVWGWGDGDGFVFRGVVSSVLALVVSSSLALGALELKAAHIAAVR